MLQIEKEYIVDEKGNPTKVVISLSDFRLIEEILGLDLDKVARDALIQARLDREKNVPDAYIDLDDIS